MRYIARTRQAATRRGVNEVDNRGARKAAARKGEQKQENEGVGRWGRCSRKGVELRRVVNDSGEEGGRVASRGADQEWTAAVERKEQRGGTEEVTLVQST